MGGKDKWENLPEARPGQQDQGGKQDVVEGTTVALFARYAVGGTKEVQAQWVITDGSKPGGEIRVNADLPSRKDVVLDDVPDDEAFYTYKYRISVNGIKQPGFAEYKVWPAHLDLEFVYEKQGPHDTSGLETGDAAANMQFFVVQGGRQTGPWTTDANGECRVNVDPGLEATILPQSPWSVFEPEDQAGMPRKRKYKVSQAAWTAKIRSHDGLGTAPTAANVHRQYVNCAQNYAAHGGPLMQLTLGPDTLADGKKDEIVYVKVSFAATNTPRIDPLPGVWTTANAATALQPSTGPAQPDGATERVFELEVPLPNDGQAAELYIQMGYAGGDACKIEVGSTPNYGDHTVHAQSWRKLNVAMIHGDSTPGAGLVSKYSVLRADQAAGFSNAQLATVQAQFEELFIEFVEARTEFYTAAQLGNAQQQRAMIVDGPYMGKAPNEKCVVVGFDELDRLATATRAPSGADTWLCLWFDYLADPAGFTLSSGVLHAGSPTEAQALDPHEGLFKYDPVTTDLSCRQIAWRAVVYDDGMGGGTRPITTPSANAAFEANRVGLSGWHVTNNPPLATIDDFVDYDNWQQVTLKAPAAHLSDNGVALGIEVAVSFDASEFTCNGCAVGGNLWMATFGGNYADNGLLGVVLHEMGHNMGMAYGLKGIGSVQATVQAYNNALAAGGAPHMADLFALGGRDADNQIPGMPFPDKAPTGYYYLGHDHVGGHCAHGLSPADRRDASYAGKNGDCIMFGESDIANNAPRAFCDVCKKYIKATDLRDIMKDW